MQSVTKDVGVGHRKRFVLGYVQTKPKDESEAAVDGRMEGEKLKISDT